MNKNTILQKWTEDSEVKYHRSHFVIFSILRTVEDILFIKKIPFFGCTGPQLWHPDFCPSLRHATALTRGGPWAPCSGSAEPQPLDHQRSPGNTCSLRGNSLYFGEGNGNPLQYSCLANPMDRGAWQAAVHGVARSWTRLSNFTFPFHFHALEKEMAATSVFLPGESQGRGSLVGCHLWGRTESDRTGATQQQQQLIFVKLFLTSCRYALTEKKLEYQFPVVDVRSLRVLIPDQ